MKQLHKLGYSCGTALLAMTAAWAQTPALSGADVLGPGGQVIVPGITAAPLARSAAPPKTNAEAAALFKDVKTAGAPAPVPGQISGNTNTPHAITDFVPVTDAALRNPDPNNWIMMRGNYQGWGFSKLNQVTKSNIKGLTMVWSRIMQPGVNEGTPLVYNGVMFLPNPNDVIQAIDATTGELLWQYRRRLPTLDQMHSNNWGQRKRSIFIYNDKVYTTTRDNFLVALDARTGKELWEVNRGGDYYATNTTGPIVVDGMVLAGATCQEAPFGCYVDAHDAQTGKFLWRNEVIPHPGQPGDETWGGKPFNERWMTGVWGPITYDPDTNIAYYGSSGVGPGAEVQRDQIGATLAGSDTRYAIDPKTGKILWKHQVLPGDNWDQECTFEMMPITTPVHPDAKAQGMLAVGRGVDSPSRKTLTGVPCKTSIAWSFDALNGNFLWAKSTVVQNIVASVDAKGIVTRNPDVIMRDMDKTYHFCPTYDGGRDWPFSAYSPETNVLYVQLQNLCTDRHVNKDNVPSLPNSQYNTGGQTNIADGKTKIGRIDAISVETGKTVWSWENLTSNYSPILATSSGLLFNGGMDRNLRAFDQANGQVIWQSRLGSQVFGAPVTYSVKGRQYIAVVSGGGFNGSSVNLTSSVDQPPGNNQVYVFALPE